MKSLYGAKMQISIPTLIEGGRFIGGSEEKAELFNDYFCVQSTIDDSHVSLPPNIYIFKLILFCQMFMHPNKRFTIC